MSENANIPPTDENRDAAHEPWQEIGRQFQMLGESLAQAVRTAWNDEENRRRVQEMQAGIESMVHEVGQAIDDTTSTPQGQKVRKEAKRTAQNLVNAGEQTVQEVRPHLLNALRQVNEELEKLVSRMDQRRGDTTPPGDYPPGETPPPPGV